MTSICINDSSNPSPHGPAVMSDPILWNGRPFLDQCSPQLLRSLWGVYKSPNVHAQEIPHISMGFRSVLMAGHDDT